VRAPAAICTALPLAPTKGLEERDLYLIIRGRQLNKNLLALASGCLLIAAKEKRDSVFKKVSERGGGREGGREGRRKRSTSWGDRCTTHSKYASISSSPIALHRSPNPSNPHSRTCPISPQQSSPAEKHGHAGDKDRGRERERERDHCERGGSTRAEFSFCAATPPAALLTVVGALTRLAVPHGSCLIACA
jgi:hypothetical protein